MAFQASSEYPILNRPFFALLLLFAVPSAFAQQTDDAPDLGTAEMVLDGVDRFYEVADTLAAGREPTAAAWDALFTAPGYARYLADSEDAAAAFEDLVRLVFDPANQAALADTLRAVEGAPSFDRLPFFAVLDARERSAELEKFRRALAEGGVGLEAAREAARLLPAGAADVPPFVFNVYKYDGTGDPDRVVADLVFLEKIGAEGARLFLAHEAHHAVRDRLSELDLPARGEDPRYYLLVALNQLRAKGIANRFDKANFFSDRLRRRFEADTSATGRWLKAFFFDYYGRGFQDAYAATPETVRGVDSLVTAAARADAAGDDETLAEASRAVYRSLPINAHPNGYFMANAITEAFGEGALVEDVANPFAFLRLYNRAAKQSNDDLPTLSAESMDYFGRLEARYVRRKH